MADVDGLEPVRGEVGMPTQPYSGPDLEAVELLGEMVRWQRGLKGAAYTAKVVRASHSPPSAHGRPAGFVPPAAPRA